ncbi:unnamed protein product [Nesidiocoris tenuis]|uniref:Menin n=1 Tax=Nesidiocoris tenuis TaxID=355587 RepID=A0A6H5GVW1_9HEMI|nr:unnamed protein product [Nesidiocoris tenuis]
MAGSPGPLVDPSVFPLMDIPSVVKLFGDELLKPDPDLTLLSIIAGAVENSMTCSQNGAALSPPDVTNDKTETGGIPTVHFHQVNALYMKFHSLIKGSIDMTLYDKKAASRELIRRVSEVVWNSLSRSQYKDSRAHLQSLYSYMTGNKLDSFGVAFAVVAGCQILGFSDVHLALSEDHSWVVFGDNLEQTIEVTWHGNLFLFNFTTTGYHREISLRLNQCFQFPGKGSEDKRGRTVDSGVNSRSWVYVYGHPVRCSRHEEVAALVSAINPSLNATTDSTEVAEFQQQLLWLLYDHGYLDKYPLALGNLAELEEIRAMGRVSCESLLKQGVLSAKRYYNNMHVYPYTYQAGYYYRIARYKEAITAWANATDVIKQYNYSRDDEEIYKELKEIANELIPYAMRVVGSGDTTHSILKDPECFADLLRFYDGICQWEEDSQTPVLHIGWAQPLISTISKFDHKVRGQVIITNAPENNNNNFCTIVDGKAKVLSDLEAEITSLESQDPKIKALTAACGERILNRDFLLQKGGRAIFKIDDRKSTPKLVLYSRKMRGLKDLLLAEKLNTQAISLQLTAQSQVQFNKKGAKDEPVGSRPKRTRRV